MAKSIEFGTDQRSQDRFQIIYQGFVLGAPDGGVRGIDTLRLALRILDKLEAISIVVEAPPSSDPDAPAAPLYYQSGDVVRRLNDAGGTLALEDVEVSLIRDHINAVPWRMSMLKQVVDTLDTLTP